MSKTYEQIISDYNAAYKWIIGRIVADATPEEGRTFESGVESYRTKFAQYERFLDFADNPEARFKSVHIAGTSGKGSVTTMIAALLQACGQRVGDHVSPYLQIPNEKLRTNGRMISPSEFTALVEDFKPTYQAWVDRGEELPYAKVWMTLTFLYFAREQVDWAVVETSVAPRFDQCLAIRNCSDHQCGSRSHAYAWRKVRTNCLA